MTYNPLIPILEAAYSAAVEDFLAKINAINTALEREDGRPRTAAGFKAAGDAVVTRVEQARAPKPDIELTGQPQALPGAPAHVQPQTAAPAIVRAAPSTHTVAEILESAKVPGPHTAHGEVVAWAESVSKGQYLQTEPSEAMVNELREGLRNGKIQRGQTALPTAYEDHLVGQISTPVEPAPADVAVIDAPDAPWSDGSEPQGAPKPTEGEKPKRRSNKQIAEDLGVNLADVVGTGNNGRITHADIENHAKAIAEGGTPAAPQAEEAPVAPQGAPVPQGAPQAAPAAAPAQFGTFPTTPYGAPSFQAPQEPQYQAPVAPPQAAPSVPPFQAPTDGPPASFGAKF